jgi:hypothetical protein
MLLIDETGQLAECHGVFGERTDRSSRRSPVLRARPPSRPSDSRQRCHAPGFIEQPPNREVVLVGQIPSAPWARPGTFSIADGRQHRDMVLPARRRPAAAGSWLRTLHVWRHAGRW